MKDFQFSLPQNIIVGRGSSNRLHEAAEKIGGTHGLLISGPVLKRMGVADKITDSLKKAGIPVDEFTDVEANPSVDTVEKAVERYKNAALILLLRLEAAHLWMWRKLLQSSRYMEEALQIMKEPTKCPDL